MGSKCGEAGSLQRPRRFGANQRKTTGKIAALKLKTNEVRNCGRASARTTHTVKSVGWSVGTDHKAVVPSRAWQKACSNALKASSKAPYSSARSSTHSAASVNSRVYSFSLELTAALN